jgi:hypothetical protein
VKQVVASHRAKGLRNIKYAGTRIRPGNRLARTGTAVGGDTGTAMTTQRHGQQQRRDNNRPEPER